MKYLFRLLLILLFSLIFFVQAESAINDSHDNQYILDISEAYNQIDQSNFLGAGKIVNDYLNANKSDANLIMGLIFLNRSFYQQALDYFKLAEKHRDAFIIPETMIDLMWHQYDVYQLTDNLTMKLMTLKRIINLIKSFTRKKEKSRFYQENLGLAKFRLGINHITTNPIQSQENFNQAMKIGLLKKTSSLYNAYYYAVTDQEAINEQFIFEKGSFRQPPLRKNAFLFYFQNFKDSKDDRQLHKRVVDSKQYSFMKFVVEKYYNGFVK